MFPYLSVDRIRNAVDVRTNVNLSFVAPFFFLKLLKTISCIRSWCAAHIMNHVTYYCGANWSCSLVPKMKFERAVFPETSVNANSLQSHYRSLVFSSVQLPEPLTYHDICNIFNF